MIGKKYCLIGVVFIVASVLSVLAQQAVSISGITTGGSPVASCGDVQLCADNGEIFLALGVDTLFANSVSSGSVTANTVNATTTGGNAILGQASAPGACAIDGIASATTGATDAVRGTTSSPGGRGVIGVAGGAGGGTGVQGNSSSGTGVQGSSTSGIGVNGTSSSGQAVRATTGGGIAIFGQATGAGACAIDGVATSTVGSVDAVRGTTSGLGIFSHGVIGVATSSGVGVQGNTGSAAGIGVVARSFNGLPGNRALQAFGFVRASGGFQVGSGASEIDHPLDPANKYLRHAVVESPDMKHIYDGVVVLDDKGEAQVQLPEWFEAVNQDFRYQLTNIGGFAPVYIAEEISGNRFKIAGGLPRLKVSWQVTGIRKDPFAQTYRVRVEEEKPDLERGLYLHPEAYGLPQTMSIAEREKKPSE